jgi:predicted AlkP superfamily pyrophosphatase or phosphodiesterase
VQSHDYDLGILWLCDPDFTQHKEGLGSPASLDAIRTNDTRLARFLLETPDSLDVIVASDHGFSTADREKRPNPDWLDLPEDRMKFGSSGIYLEEPERDLERIVGIVKNETWIGPVFLRESFDGQRGVIEETFSQDILRIAHQDRAPDVVYSKRWSDGKNAFGISGMVWGTRGVATHGSLSPYDRRCVLVAAGPSLKAGIRTDAPSSAVDIAPTVLHLFGEKASLDGRVLREGLRGETEPEEVERTRLEGVAPQTLVFARVGESTYLDAVEL